MCIDICLGCIRTDQRHVVEWRNQEAVVEQTQVNILLELEVTCVGGFFAGLRWILLEQIFTTCTQATA